MSLSRPAQGRPGYGRARRLAFARAGLLGFMLVAAGCATSGPPPSALVPAAPAARLEVVNLTNYEWSITIAGLVGNETQAARIQPQATVHLDLRGGDYLIDQAVVAANPDPELTRRIAARLEAGRTYRWPLVTLLSDPTGEPERERRK